MLTRYNCRTNIVVARKRLDKAVRESPFFDTALWARGFERVCFQMWDAYEAHGNAGAVHIRAVPDRFVEQSLFSGLRLLDFCMAQIICLENNNHDDTWHHCGNLCGNFLDTAMHMLCCENSAVIVCYKFALSRHIACNVGKRHFAMVGKLCWKFI